MYVRTYARAYVCMYVSMYVYVCLHMYTYICLSSSSGGKGERCMLPPGSKPPLASVSVVWLTLTVGSWFNCQVCLASCSKGGNNTAYVPGLGEYLPGTGDKTRERELLLVVGDCCTPGSHDFITHWNSSFPLCMASWGQSVSLSLFLQTCGSAGASA